MNGGNEECAIYIGVECLGQCAYNITLNQTDDAEPPYYLQNQKYFNGQVEN